MNPVLLMDVLKLSIILPQLKTSWQIYTLLTDNKAGLLCSDTSHVAKATVEAPSPNLSLRSEVGKSPVLLPPALVPRISGHCEVEIQHWAPRKHAHLRLLHNTLSAFFKDIIYYVVTRYTRLIKIHSRATVKCCEKKNNYKLKELHCLNSN